MTNRWVRVLLFVLALVASAGASYQAWLDEQAVTRGRAAAMASERAASTATALIGDLRAALYAHVAAGQGHAFWTARAGSLLDAVRASVLELDSAAAAAGAPLTDTLDTLDRLTAASQRAGEYVRQGQSLLAGDVIFGESRDLLDAARLQVARAGDAVREAEVANEAAIRRRQMTTIATAMGVALLITVLLVPTGRSIASAQGEPSPAMQEPRFQDSPLTSAETTLALDTGSGASDAPVNTEPLVLERAALEVGQPENVAVPLAPAGPDLTATAALCVDLARITDSTELPALLARAAGVLDASGIILWVANRDGSEIFPVSSYGYDERVFARIGSLPRDEHNLTADAFRESSTRTATAVGQSHAALAIPLLGPGGAVGVLSAELRDVPDVPAGAAAVGSIIAAQLAMLVGSMPASDTEPEAQQAQA